MLLINQVIKRPLEQCSQQRSYLCILSLFFHLTWFILTNSQPLCKTVPQTYIWGKAINICNLQLDQKRTPSKITSLKSKVWFLSDLLRVFYSAFNKSPLPTFFKIKLSRFIISWEFVFVSLPLIKHGISILLKQCSKHNEIICAFYQLTCFSFDGKMSATNFQKSEKYLRRSFKYLLPPYIFSNQTW